MTFGRVLMWIRFAVRYTHESLAGHRRIEDVAD